MKVYILGGFLGAGKTTLACAAVRLLQARAERVALIVNDQGRSLVDTWRCREAGADVREITGGCFCCRYDELEDALLAADRAGATAVIAEAVGSCTDLVATVLAPLADRRGDRLTLAPLAVVADPWRIIEMASGDPSSDIAFLFRKQLEEADVVLLSRSDLDPPDVSATLRDWRIAAPVLPVSGLTGTGLDAWLGSTPDKKASPLQIDYDRYAAAEAQLAWFNGRVSISLPSAAAPSALMHRFLDLVAVAPIAHVKITSLDPSGANGALVRRGAAPVITDSAAPRSVYDLTWLINARVATEPADLDALLRDALNRAVGSALVEWQDVECFRPGRPVPAHRYAQRCSVTSGATCCTAFYQRPDVRQLLGDSYHPGGVPLTLQLAEHLALGSGRTLLDVACGNGASLRAIRQRLPIRGLGLDLSPPTSNGDGLELRAGDAHAIPCGDASVDAILCECALSTFIDQPGALREMHRVVRPGGRVAISDMVLEGTLPATLQEWLHNGTCLEQALSSQAYVQALEAAGFVMCEQWDASTALRELLLRVKRNLVSWLAAAATSSAAAPPFDARAARGMLREAERAVADEMVRYGVFIAERPPPPPAPPPPAPAPNAHA
ncbi:MAG: GTP-binding protein [Gemmatimonadaceae bacterium]